MKKILFMVPYPQGKAPSQRFRFEHFLKFMEEKSTRWDFQPFVFSKDWDSIYKKGEIGNQILVAIKGFLSRFTCLFKLSKYDFVFIHREAAPFGPPVFEWVIAKILQKKIIYDFDDAIWLPDQHKENLIWKWLKWRSKVKLICKWSWKVSVGNDYLADFARRYNQNVVIFPTVVDTEVHVTEIRRLETGDRRSIVGWTGSHSTLQYLNMILPTLQELEKDTDFEFRVIANQDPQLPLKNYSFIDWNEETEIEDLSTLDIGVMPLPNDEWAKGKCGFKLIQYFALEIPAVASPVGVNPQIIQHGKNGFLANTDQEWVDSLKKLIENPPLRMNFGKTGREKIVECYSEESQKDAFLNLFN